MDTNRDYTFEEIPDSSHNEQDFYAKFRERLDDVQKFQQIICSNSFTLQVKKR